MWHGRHTYATKKGKKYLMVLFKNVAFLCLMILSTYKLTCNTRHCKLLSLCKQSFCGVIQHISEQHFAISYWENSLALFDPMHFGRVKCPHMPYFIDLTFPTVSQCLSMYHLCSVYLKTHLRSLSKFSHLVLILHQPPGDFGAGVLEQSFRICILKHPRVFLMYIAI